MSSTNPGAVLPARERGSKSYVRFIVLCAARTGSYMLTYSLNDSPNIVCFGELFHPVPKHVDFRVDGYEMLDPEEKAFRNRDFKGFLDQRIFCERPDEIGAVGFKAPHVQFVMVPHLLDWLIEERDIHVLHLKRRNVLRRLVSLRIATATGAWIDPPAPALASLRDPGSVLDAIVHLRQTIRDLRKTFLPKEPAWKATRVPVELSEQECRDFFAKEMEDNAHYDERFREHPKLTLYYEDIVDHCGATLGRVQAFLGLTPRRLAPRTRQQNPEPLRELLVNYDELYEAFSGTPEAAYFE